MNQDPPAPSPAPAPGCAAAFKLIRLYLSDKGIWRYEFNRHGRTYWSSLKTRDEAKARAVYNRMAATLAGRALTR